ncbi:30S ribosomal protein S5 [Candidatus Karelsulcia muelleri]
MNRQVKKLKEKLVTLKRVCKVTKGRRYFSFTALVVKGNKNGLVGFGVGKAKEPQNAIRKAGDQAEKRLVKISLKGGTIPHEQKAKHGSTSIFLYPASEGTGIIAGGVVRIVLELVGVKNIFSKWNGSSNSNNCIRAVILALTKIRNAYTISKERGLSIKNIFEG